MNIPEQDIVAIGGYWEPLAFYRRGGGWFADDETSHASCFTREAARRLGELAVTVAMWPGYKGLGLRHERAEWDRLKPFRKYLEREGIELGAYLQCGTISVPDHGVRQIADYVRGGGRVLAVGQALSCDEWGRRRSRATVKPLHGERSRDFGNSQGRLLEQSVVRAWLGVEGEAGRRVFAFPKLVHPGPIVWDPDEQRAPVLNDDYHMQPVNQIAFIAAVRQALGRVPAVEVLAPKENPYVVPTLLGSNRDGRLSLHALNYRHTQPVDRLSVRLTLPMPRSVRNVELLRLDSDRRPQVKVGRTKEGVILTLPAFRIYAGAILE